MFFSRTRTILSINSAGISWTKGKILTGKLFGELQKKPWSEENLAAAIQDIADNYPTRVRVVVGEEFCYATSFAKDGSDIAAQVQQRIPEKLMAGWDSSQKNVDTVQVMVVKKEIFALLQKLFSEKDLRAEAVEVESVSAARLLPKVKNEILLFARYDSVVLLGAARERNVLTAQVLDDFPTAEKIKEFSEYVSRTFGLPTSRAYVQEGEHELTGVFVQAEMEVEQIQLDPMVGICRKRHLRGKDENVLNIDLQK